jgi:hypothetical protein
MLHLRHHIFACKFPVVNANKRFFDMTGSSGGES